MTDRVEPQLLAKRDDETLLRKFRAGYSVHGIADEFGVAYPEIEMRLRAICCGIEIALRKHGCCYDQHEESEGCNV